MNLNDFLSKDDNQDIKIENTTLKDDIVILKLKDEDDNYKIKVTVDDYYNYKLKENGYISFEVYEELKKKESIILAYKGALRRLGIKDYSESSMRSALNKKYQLSKKDLDSIIQKLKDYDYLNDERFVKYRIDNLLNKSCSKRMIYKKIKEEGIDEKLIDKFYPKNNQELENIEIKANKYLKMIKNKSLNAKKQAIIAKLVNDEFDMSLIKSTVEHLDYSNDLSEQHKLLKKEFNKACLKYTKKFEGYELKSKIYSYLMSKGFNSEEINKVISEGNIYEEN